MHLLSSAVAFLPRLVVVLVFFAGASDIVSVVSSVLRLGMEWESLVLSLQVLVGCGRLVPGFGRGVE